MDVTTAYLQGNIDEEIYVEPPVIPKNKNIEEEKEKVWWLKKAIYGLKQSGRCWNAKLNKVLISLRLTQSKSDPCIYTKTYQSNIDSCSLCWWHFYIYQTQDFERKYQEEPTEKLWNEGSWDDYKLSRYKHHEERKRRKTMDRSERSYRENTQKIQHDGE